MFLIVHWNSLNLFANSFLGWFAGKLTFIFFDEPFWELRSC